MPWGEPELLTMGASLPELAWITSEDELCNYVPGFWDLGGGGDPLGLAPFTPQQATHQLNLIKSDISQGFTRGEDGLLSEHKNLLAKGSKQPSWLSQPCCQTLSAFAGSPGQIFPSQEKVRPLTPPAPPSSGTRHRHSPWSPPKGRAWEGKE